MLRIVVLVCALAGCETNPSLLDGVGGGIDSRTTTWRAIEARAAPMSARLDLLRSATRGPRTTPAELRQRGDDLIAWMDAGGMVPPPPLLSAFNDLGIEGIVGLVRESLAARPTDDRMVEAVLYVAAHLRRDGTGMLDGVVANAIMEELLRARATPPTFAARYAPTDAEVYRLFATEAMFARRATFEIGHDDGGALAFHEQLAGAPTERAGFLAALQQAGAPLGTLGTMYMAHATTLFGAVDNYRAWLAVK